MAKKSIDLVHIADTVTKLQPQIEAGIMLVQLGLVSYKKLKAFFASQGHDDETLAAIVVEFDARIARRS